MFCPRCGQERISEETSFCSRCGFLLTAVTALLESGGNPDKDSAPRDGKLSARSRGIRQGLFMFLLTFVIAPIVGLISQFGFGIDPWPVGLVVFGLGIGGLLRIVYALMFESKVPSPPGIEHKNVGSMQIPPPFRSNALPGASAQSEFDRPSAFDRRETNDLQPHSVTDNTTKLLEKDS